MSQWEAIVGPISAVFFGWMLTTITVHNYQKRKDEKKIKDDMLKQITKIIEKAFHLARYFRIWTEYKINEESKDKSQQIGEIKVNIENLIMEISHLWFYFVEVYFLQLDPGNEYQNEFQHSQEELKELVTRIALYINEVEEINKDKFAEELKLIQSVGEELGNIAPLILRSKIQRKRNIA